MCYIRLQCTGGWSLPEGIGEVKTYFWFSKLISGFRIETIGLIAGYVFSYQSLTLKRKYEFKSYTIKKFNRLIIPAFVFGVFYFFFFQYDKETFNILTLLLKLSSGIGHLWFLPMLFWCYVLLWVLDRYKHNEKLMFIGLAIMSILPMPFPLPFGLNRVFHFLFYCYGGYLLYKEKAWIDKFNKIKNILLLIAIYVLLIIFLHTTLVPLGWAEGLVLKDKVIMTIISNGVRFVITVSGILALFFIVTRYTNNDGFEPEKWVIESSSLCYGVYVFHQFILLYLYYDTSLPDIFGTYWLPIVGFSITIVLSIILTKLLLKTKTGRFLIG